MSALGYIQRQTSNTWGPRTLEVIGLRPSMPIRPLIDSGRAIQRDLTIYRRLIKFPF